MDGTAYEQCEDRGTGADGSWIVSGVSTASLAGGTYNFTDFTLPEGVHLDITGTSPLIIRATGTVTIDGTIDLRGENGVHGTEAVLVVRVDRGAVMAQTPAAATPAMLVPMVSTMRVGTWYRVQMSHQSLAETVVREQMQRRKLRWWRWRWRRHRGGCLSNTGGWFNLGAGGKPSVAGGDVPGRDRCRRFRLAPRITRAGFGSSPTGLGGRSRIDAHNIEDESIDSRTQGTTDGLPPALHVYQSISGVVWLRQQLIGYRVGRFARLVNCPINCRTLSVVGDIISSWNRVGPWLQRVDELSENLV